MKPVAETHHLQRRGSIWHYYRRVPLHLVPVIGRKFIKQSLGVSDLKQAKVLRNALNVKVDVQFAAAEQALASPGQTGDVVPVSLAILTEHLRSHIEQIDRRSAQRLPPMRTGASTRFSCPPRSRWQRIKCFIRFGTLSGMPCAGRRFRVKRCWQSRDGPPLARQSATIMAMREIRTSTSNGWRRSAIPVSIFLSYTVRERMSERDSSGDKGLIG